MRQLLLSYLLFFSISLFAQKQNNSTGFTENKGQIIDQKGRKNKAVLYLLNTNGLNVQLRKNGFSYDVYETKKHPLTQKQIAQMRPSTSRGKDTLKTPNYSLEYIYHRIDIDFEGSNPNVNLLAEGKSTDYDNYYNVPSEPNGITNVHKYQTVTYQNIYPNIDVIFSIPEDKNKPVEYNFVVKPNGKISDIQLKFKGVKTELVDNKIKIDVRFGQMEETLPKSWTENGTDKREIAIGYKQLKKNVYGFESTENLAGKKVVIDPVPTRLWGTYYGGLGDEGANHIEIDNNYNVLISGNSNGSSNIATSGSYLSFSATECQFIAKFDANGTRLWGSYYPFLQAAFQLDNLDNIYVYGSISYSMPSIPSPGCFQDNKNNYSDGILIKLNSLGFKEWGTYYGGNFNESIFTICFDSANNVYIGGETSSTDFHSTPGAYQMTKNSKFGDYYDGFIAKFDTNGNRIWGTFYGGTNNDYFTNLSISNDGFLFAIGTSESSDNIATSGAYQSTTSASQAGMIIKFTLSGQRIWGTYIFDDSNIFTAKLQGNNLYLTGETFGSTTVGTKGTFFEKPQTVPKNSSFFLETNPLPPYGASKNSYVASFNIQTQQKKWGTFFFERIWSIDVNQNDEIYFSGETLIDTGIATPDAYQPTKSLISTCYLIKLNSIGQRVWGTYYGGEYGSEIGDAKLDKQNAIYLCGATGSITGIATANAYQSSLSSNPDSFFVKFQDCQSTTLAKSNSPICIGSSLNLTASGGTNYAWTGPNGFTSIQQNPSINNINSTHSGQYICTITGTAGCDGDVKIDVVVGDTIKPLPDTVNLPTITGDCHTVISTIPTATDNCAGVINATTTDPLSYTLPGTYMIHWNYNDGNGNTETQTQTVIINTLILPTVGSPQNFCIQQNATINNINITGQNIKWYDSSAGGNVLPSTTLLVKGTTNYYASQTINGCESSRVPVTINIQDNQAPIPDTINLQTIAGDCHTVISTIPTSTDNCAGKITATTTDPLNYTLPGTYTIHWNYDDGNGNIETQMQSVIINAIELPTVVSPQTFCVQQNATINNINITGQTVKYYDTLAGGNTLSSTTPLVNGINYYASQTINTCESLRVPVTVNIQDTPAPSGDANQTFCTNSNPSINNITVTGTNINWYDSISGNNILSSSTALTDGNTYYASQTVNGCESVSRIAIKTALISTLNAKNDSELVCDNLNDGKENVNLTSYNSKLIDNSTTYTFEYYNSQSAAENQTLSDQITMPTDYNLTSNSKIIYVRIMSNIGCDQIVSLTLTFTDTPIIGISDTVSFCEKDNIVVDAGKGFDSYSWSTGATGQQIKISEAGNYSVAVTKNHGDVVCSTQKDFALVASNVATISNIETKDFTDTENTIAINVNGLGVYEYSLDGIHFQDSNTFSGLLNGLYTAYVRDKNGCGTVTQEAYLLMYPKFFTPNGDSYNDTWKIKFSYFEPELKVVIFDRFGKLLKQLLHTDDSWDGKFNGNDVPSDDYWFIVSRKDGSEYKGHFSLKR